jgi:hypothetical protein
VQEVGFPTRNEGEGGRRPVCTSAARKIGVLLARARDGVPQEGLVSWFARSAGQHWGGCCGQERPAEEGAGRRWLPSRLQAGGEPSPLSGSGLGRMSGGVLRNEANVKSEMFTHLLSNNSHFG